MSKKKPARPFNRARAIKEIEDIVQEFGPREFTASLERATEMLRSAVASAAQPLSSDDDWTPVTTDKWAETLESARALAIRRLSNVGLVGGINAGDDAATSILETSMGTDLVPRLAREQANVKAAVAALDDGPVVDLAAVIFNYGMAVADAAFLLGVVHGTQTSWPIVQAIEPPARPPTRKGGAR
ncbi:MAG: hypothetical protein ABJA98_12415 [Acidobacteriota bacterium]